MSERTKVIEQLEENLRTLRSLDDRIDIAVHHISNELRYIKDIGTAFIITCNDTPVKVVIGNNNHAVKILQDLQEESDKSDSIDQGIFHIKEVPWE